ncbi:hypothetical protein [Candidatus Neomicrothrix sp.]|uniref:hypothetical protein n=1 Tax=Candidatus Neomicrothrix sp. TaxID=2719034 RepID=UPI00259AAA5F|nr:hypothetical protein [Candidatus Microthrix sp.]HMS49611.1 hypothetical protein [Candidatus Microthrix sp.]
MAEVEAHDEVIEWLDGLNQSDWHRTSVVIDRLNNERAEVDRARKAARNCAEKNP